MAGNLSGQSAERPRMIAQAGDTRLTALVDSTAIRRPPCIGSSGVGPTPVCPAGRRDQEIHARSEVPGYILPDEGKSGDRHGRQAGHAAADGNHRETVNLVSFENMEGVYIEQIGNTSPAAHVHPRGRPVPCTVRA